MRRTPTVLVLSIASLALVGGGCFNDALRGHEFHGVPGSDRFELVIEPDRTLFEGTHFLVDRATGDVWRLEASDGRSARWVRLADGPDDAEALRVGFDPEPVAKDDG